MEQENGVHKILKGGVLSELWIGIKKFIFLFFSIVVAVVVLVLIGLSFGSTDNTTPSPVVEEKKREYSDIEAYANAQVILEKFLKSPSTAEYPVASEATIKKYDDNSFQVSAYVDSQNGFGAMIRSDWTVFLKFEGESVTTRGVIFDGEVLFKEESTEQGS